MADRLYRAPDAAALAVVPLDALTAIYHRLSGTTHLLASPAPEILVALAGQALTAAALLDALRRDYALADADPAALVARLDELAEAGLVAAS